MTFPQTRLTLIERLAAGGSEQDWGEFLRDYWGPICRFSLRYGAPNLDEAEDAAAAAFEALWKNRLLVRWVSQRTAKLRTLLCAVSRNVLANRARLAVNRLRAPDALNVDLDEWLEAPQEEIDAFYAAWVEELVQQAVEACLAEYGRQGKANYVRVLYGRICDQLSIAEVSEALGIKHAEVDNYYRHARQRLKESLDRQLRIHIERYAPADDVEEEFRQEWGRLGDYLAAHGGLEEAMRQSYRQFEASLTPRTHSEKRSRAVTQLSGIGQQPPLAQ